MRYPLEFKVSASTLDAWAEDELASWEDQGEPVTGHVRNIVHPAGRRYRTKLVIREPRELELVLRSLEYHGTRGLWDDRHAYRAALERLRRRILEVAR